MDALVMRLSPEELRRQRKKNIALALSLLALVVLFFMVTLVKLGGS
jgi:hypothetical protein